MSTFSVHDTESVSRPDDDPALMFSLKAETRADPAIFSFSNLTQKGLILSKIISRKLK